MSIPYEIRLNEDPLLTVATTGSGDFTALLPKVSGYFLGVRMEPLTPTTIYHVSILDQDLFEIFKRRSVAGPLVAHVDPEVLKGSPTITISGATVNEAFTIKMLVSGGGVL